METERLVLREYLPEDWEAVHEYASIPEFSRFEEWGPNTEEDTRRFVAEGMAKAKAMPRLEYQLAVVLRSPEKLIGGVSLRLHYPGAGEASLGYSISPSHQGRGFATEAARALIDFGFRALALARIRAGCDAENFASQRVMEKAGMKRTAFFKGDKMLRGEPRDSYEYEIRRP